MGHQRMKRSDQRGMASIIITMVTMVVISLIVIGFAVISRREQRQSLDQLLSSQAFYAAESGVEDARAVISKAVKTGQQVIPKDNCTTNNPGGTYPTGTQMAVDETYDVRYTCLKVDPAPDSLQFDGVSENSVVVPISTSQPITSVKITWKPSSSSSNPMSGCPSVATNNFKPQTGWGCGHGVMRIDMVPTDNGLTSAGLQSGLLSAFFVPVTTGSPGRLQYNISKGQANVVAADCSSSTSCSATIDNITTGVQKMTLRLSAMYQPSNITVRALNGSNAQSISGVQASIDSTGRASDTLRRIQVRLPIVQTSSRMPNNAITSNGSICKRFSVTPTYFNIPSITDADPNNDMCKQKTVGTTGNLQCKAQHDIVFVLDRSGSMLSPWTGGKSRIDSLIDVTSSFIKGTNINTGGNHASIVVFSDYGWEETELTGDQSKLLAVMNSFDDIDPDDGTSYGDGLYEVLPRFSNAAARAGVLKDVIFISDGAPNDDYDAIYDDTDNIKAQGVRFYTVGIGDPGDPDNALDEDLLTDMAGNGGTYSDATSFNQLQAAIDSISQDISCD